MVSAKSLGNGGRIFIQNENDTGDSFEFERQLNGNPYGFKAGEAIRDCTQRANEVVCK